MIATSRLSSVAQVAGVALAALACYLVSQTVATERAALAKVDRRISAVHDEIAKLETEIGVRSRQPQLERWNGQVLSLRAPKPRQFVADGVQLVAEFSVGPRPALPLDPAITSQQAVNKVAYQPAPAPEPAPARAAPVPTPVAPEAAPARPMLQTAAYVRPKVDRLAPDVSDIVKASFRVPATAPAAKPKPAASPAQASSDVIAKAVEAAKASARTSPKPSAAKPGPSHAPTVLASLLPSDIGRLAAAEKAQGKTSKNAAGTERR